MNTFLELVKLRTSVRRYDGRPVDRELALQCAEAARLAPSACNSQPWRFILCDDAEVLGQLRSSARSMGMNSFVDQAPMIAVLCSDGGNIQASLGGKVKGIPYHYIDIGIAAEHFCLAAAEAGAGTCMIGWFNKKKVSSALGLPPGIRPLLLITLGYEQGDARREKRRKNLDEILSWNRYTRQ